MTAKTFLQVAAGCAVLMLGIGACSSGGGGGGVGPGDPPDFTYELVNAFPNLSFTRPVDLQSPDDGSDRIFVLEQAGRVMVFPNDPNVQAADLKVFLDIRQRVDDSDNEEGLLGLAFPADYMTSGEFYLYYNDAVAPNRTQLARFDVSGDADVAVDNPDVIVQFGQPAPNHNGGSIHFGPNDGYMYIALGDGGGFNDTHANGQNRTTLLGSILRIDVNSTQGQLNYAIPSENPFVGNANNWREEIWAWGVRNPWRMSFDAVTGWLWVGDVGQGKWEEVDVVEKGKNYGWVVMEGNECVTPNCDQTGLELPVWVYEHPSGAARAITGGYVYRGSALPGLLGAYIYADYLTGEVWALRYDGTTASNEPLLDATFRIAAFGLDRAGEIYVCGFDGRIYRIQATQVEEVEQGS